MAQRTADPLVPVTLVVGPEALLSERALAAVVRAARSTDAEADVTDVSGGDLTPGSLAEYISPSLFATTRVLLVRDMQDIAENVGEILLDHVKAPIDGIFLGLAHPGGVKSKKLLDRLRKAGALEIKADRLTKPDDQVGFVRAEVRHAGGRIDEPAARQLVDAVGADLRGLAAAAAQLASDAEDAMVTSDLVATYFEGRAEVKGWVVADRAVEGHIPQAVEQLRWALQTGTDPVLVIGALATSLRSLAKLAGSPRGLRDADIARDVGVPPWKIRVLRGQLRGWSADGLAEAIRAVAAADLAVKGGANDAALALTTALVQIGQARDL